MLIAQDYGWQSNVKNRGVGGDGDSMQQEGCRAASECSVDAGGYRP